MRSYPILLETKNALIPHTVGDEKCARTPYCWRRKHALVLKDYIKNQFLEEQ